MGEVYPGTRSPRTLHHPLGHDCGICRGSRDADEAVRRQFRPGTPSWRPGLRSYLAAAFVAGALTVAALDHTVLSPPYTCITYNGGSGFTCARR
jgi:predicted branched-subunit amino acid permease